MGIYEHVRQMHDFLFEERVQHVWQFMTLYETCMKLGSEHVQRCFALSYISFDSQQSRLHLGWRSK